MVQHIKNAFNLRQNELRLVLIIGFLLFSNSIAQQVSEISAVSNFLSAGGVNQILIVWIIDSIIILVMMGIQSLVIDKFNRIALLSWAFLIFALSFIVLRILFIFHAPGWLNYGLLFLISEQQFLFLPMVIWIVSSEIFSLSQAKRVFPVIASGEFLGKLVGICISAAIPSVVNALPDLRSEDMLIFNALIYLVAYLIVIIRLKYISLRQTSQTNETMKESLTEGWGFIREVPVFRYLALLILLVLITDTIVEFRFLVVTDNVYKNDPGQYQVFYSLYRLAMVTVSIILQTFVSGRIMARAKLKDLFYVEPAGSLIGSTLMMLPASLFSAVGAMFFLKIPQTTIGKSTRKAFQSLVPEERRGRVSIFMDSYLFSAGTFVGCIISGTVILIGSLTGGLANFYIYLGFALISSLSGLFVAYKLRASYDTSMLNWRLKRRERGKSVLDKLEF